MQTIPLIERWPLEELRLCTHSIHFRVWARKLDHPENFQNHLHPTQIVES